MVEPRSTPWTCPTCKVVLATPFCSECGEEPIAPADLTLRAIAAKVIHALTSIDARAMRSARLLLRRPGELTLAWTGGIRKPYVAPFQLFLIANVIFFTVQWITGENVFSSSLDSHLHHQDWSELAQTFLSRRPFMSHVVFSLHFYTFLLLLFCIALLLGKASGALGIGGIDDPMVDKVLTVFNLLACALFVITLYTT